MAHQVAVMYLGNIVEVLPGEHLKDIVVHPYSKALIGSIFDVHMDYSKPIESIDSEIPSPLDVPPGCPFQNRCEHCMDKCTKEKPKLKEIGEMHKVACHLF
jgi:oligopeptide/dipeptide ABC transporter ATP-binding protein